MRMIRDFIKKLLTGIAEEIIKLAIIPLLMGIGTYILHRSKGGFTKLEIILLILLFVIILTNIGYAVWRLCSYNSYYYPGSKIKSQYYEEKKIIRYTISSNKLLYSRELDIVSNINGLDCISDKYIWTGGDVKDLPKGVLGINTIEQQMNIGIWKYFRIEFDEKLPKKKKKTIKYQWPDIDDYEKSAPFFSAQTDVPCKKIEFQIDLGEKYANKRAIFEEMRGTEGGTPLERQELVFDKHGEIKHVVHHPKRFRYYSIRWSWNDSQIPEIPGE